MAKGGVHKGGEVLAVKFSRQSEVRSCQGGCDLLRCAWY